MVPTPALAITIENGQAAAYILGQANFTASSSTISQSVVAGVVGVTVDVLNGRVFIANQNRILVFDTAAGITNGMDASYVLGQADFTSTFYPAASISQLRAGAMAYDQNNNRLFAIDSGASRVLVFDVASITNGEDAVYVLGQEDFTSSSANNGNAGAVQDGFGMSPSSLFYDTTKDFLYVSDTSNHRVLAYDLSGGITNGMNASYVLGQTDFTSSTSDAGVYSDSKFNGPTSVTMDTEAQLLFVGDRNNNRVLVFNVASITNGESAVYVIGQPDFTTVSESVTAGKLSDPRGLAYDEVSDHLFVSDGTKNRVLAYDLSGGITNGMNASYVLGQTDFTSSTQNAFGEFIDDGRGGGSNAPCSSCISGSTEIAYASNDDYFYVSNDSRVLVFDFTDATPPPDPAEIVYSGSFTESENDDGSLTGSRIATITNDTFVNAGGALVQDIHFTINDSLGISLNLDGLTAVMTVNESGTTATLTFTGNAVSHSEDITDLTITFQDGAFTTNATASNVTGYTDFTGVIDFITNLPAEPSPARISGSIPRQKIKTQQETTLCPSDQILTQNLRAGARDGRYHWYTKAVVKEVKILQAHMNRLGFNSGPVDGILGPITDGAIKRMQISLHTKPDGFIGPITRALINTSCTKL